MDNFDLGDCFPWDQDSDWDSRNEYGSKDEPKVDDANDNESDKEDSECDSESGLTQAQRNFLEARANSIHLGERGGGTRVNDHDYKEQITDWILDQDGFSVRKEHRIIIRNWLALFNQTPGGHFARLNKVGPSLRRDFVSLN